METKLTPAPVPAVEILLETLKQRFPLAFSDDPSKVRPLKIGIHKELRGIFGGQFTSKCISRALKRYTKSPNYLQSLQLDAPRFDLQGNACGTVTSEHLKTGLEMEERAKEAKAAKKARRAIRRLSSASKSKSITRGKLEIVLRLPSLPEESIDITSNGWFGLTVEAENRKITFALRPKVWQKVQKSIQDYENWTLVIRGRIHRFDTDGNFSLLEPAVQVVEKKGKTRFRMTIPEQ